MASKPCEEKPASTDNCIESAVKSSLNFIENETEKAVSMVERGVETVLSPFERCIAFIRHECDLMEKSKQIIEEACDLISNLGNFLQGEPNFFGFISLLLWIGFCYIFEVWMIPLLIPFIFLRQFILVYFKYFMIEINDDQPETKAEEKSITEMLQELCDVCDSIDNGIEITASVIKTTKRTLNFKEPEICYLALLISTLSAIILYHIPLRYFVIFGSIYLFSKNYLEVNGYLRYKEE
ncbi:multiple C2 and transmembrane domain-containing protein-like [Coccinella septempunctata]|uniref:multiple C2 and transmembrane domain-containing protein-like n=1 Tax=Coccinella septempunctata TaxID=41139 RepID=UPI001D082EB0|nr:multiple C2 and transmembrane domain-containing protein-like [Coccinella septempunctata]XP_044745666.1 multiple C2 and transmembrane domain-containing protein-like [Coccinella septempunctata]XP_044745667.1 multiple C2 and transmembrane domain-containing protein-like [Coccinella septempunctata]